MKKFFKIFEFQKFSHVWLTMRPSSTTLPHSSILGKLASLHWIHEWYKSKCWDVMRSKWPLAMSQRGIKPQFIIFEEKYVFYRKKQWKKQDLNLQSSSLKSSALPTELCSQDTEYFKILLYLLICQQTKYRKVASSRPVYYSILELFGQRSQYISIKFPLYKPSENLKICY